ncbi:NifB/NifX family molybdenum-iron cluster-binding protein [Thermodesulfobacteriota bacterium]
MSEKLLITIWENNVAPRFDLATEVLIARIDDNRSVTDQKTMVLAHESTEDLCQLILNEEVGVVVCGGIEEEYFDYLTWKKVKVMDSVMGPWERALDRFKDENLKPGDILFERPERRGHV